MTQTHTDRNLLFGILALQMDFITRDQLVKAMQDWVLDKSRTLGEVLLNNAVVDKDTHALIEALVQKHLAQHGNDPQKSLAAVPSATSICNDLKNVTDADVQASLSRVSSGTEKQEPDDPYATRAGGSATVQLPAAAATAHKPSTRFRVIRPHARGGLGEVLVARDEELNREVALKRIQDRHSGDADSQARFMLEAEITGGLEHPGIVPVYSLGHYADGRPYYAMRFIRGDSLKEAIERFHKADKKPRDPGERSLELRALLGRFVDVCNAIAYAHSRGVLHRDLKPGNIMLGKYGETLVVDWGLAKTIGDSSPTVVNEPGEGTLTPSSASFGSHTMMGSAMGTPQFMSPEQAEGRLDILGPAADVYSLGATLYSLLTGTVPINETDVSIVLDKVKRGEFPPPSTVKSDTPKPLDAICMKAMARDPKNRYATPTELGADIEHWLADEPVSAWPEPWTVKVRRWVSRHRTLVTGVASAIVVATVGLAVATGLLTAANEEIRKQRDNVELQRKKAESNFQLARAAVDRYHTEVSESVLLHEPGMQPLRRQLLADARDFYQGFVDGAHGNEPDVQSGLGRAMFRLAQITGDIDSELKAIELHQKAQKILEPLAAAQPNDAELQSDLASCLHNQGRLYRRTDQPGKAEESYKNALTIWEKLAAANGEERYRAEEARTQLGLGNIYQSTRRLDKAQAIYEKVLATRARLARANPKVAEYQRDLAVTQSNLARVYSSLGQKDKAEIAYHDAIDVQKQLVKDFSYISQYQNDLARSHYNLGELFVQYGDNKPAEAPFKEAARIWTALTLRHPTVTEFQINLAEAYTRLARVYSAAADLPKAEGACKQALEIKQTLAIEYKDVHSYQGDLARGYMQLGNVYRDNNKGDKAIHAYDDALAILGNLAKDHTEVPQYQADLARTFNDLGLVYADQNSTAKAKDAYEKALAEWEKLNRTNRSQWEFEFNLAQTNYNLGNLLRKDNPGAALDWYAKALRILDSLGEEQRNEATVQTALRNLYWKRADTRTAIGRHGEALEDWEIAVKLAGKAQKPWFQLYRAEAMARAGQHANAVAEAESLASKAGKNGQVLYHLVRIYAQAAGAAAVDVKLSPENQLTLKTSFADKAIGLLERANDSGYFKTSANVESLKNDTDLDPIRMRPEFVKLMARLQAKG